MENKKNNKGFSLVELIVVIAIMAVLVGVLAPTLLRYVEKSRVQKDQSAIAEVVEAITVALAEESVNEKVSTSTTVTIADEVAVASNIAELQTELQKTIVGTVNFSSKALSGKQVVITLQAASATDPTIVVPSITYSAADGVTASTGVAVGTKTAGGQGGNQQPDPNPAG